MRLGHKIVGYRGDVVARSVNGLNETNIDTYARTHTVHNGSAPHWHRPLSFDHGQEQWHEGRMLGIKRLLDGDDHIPGIRSMMDRAPSPPGVLRYRTAIAGTGQCTPCTSFFEVWVSVPKPHGRLP